MTLAISHQMYWLFTATVTVTDFCILDKNQCYCWDSRSYFLLGQI